MKYSTNIQTPVTFDQQKSLPRASKFSVKTESILQYRVEEHPYPEPPKDSQILLQPATKETTYPQLVSIDSLAILVQVLSEFSKDQEQHQIQDFFYHQ